MKINERGGVAFINQAHVKSNFISLKMYELDTKVNPNKGKLNRY
jgi:hypothetical protein